MDTLDNGGLIAVEVAYALAQRQVIIPMHVPVGTTALTAATRSGIAAEFDGLDIAASQLGVFGRKVEPDHVLASGDRVEIYRPLIADPKEVRRQRALMGKSMGKRPAVKAPKDAS